ncbi:hypothetical protein [Bradyrhizobium sp. th.b2]|uniref:hypothetical protein n=1 Tax=Bradyrhizobium sp. th-b2 TaxID=172088 RepID=UPI0012EBCA3A|nr:hypothetical protein [Bradyrhizobium sp. th.b2]
MLQIDDLVEPRPEKIVRSRRFVLLRPLRGVPSDADRESCFARRGNLENEIASFRCPKHQNLAISEHDFRSVAWKLLTGDGLQLHQRLGGEEGQAPSGACSETKGLLLEAVE